MASGKRASMREGPLAALFRSTERAGGGGSDQGPGAPRPSRRSPASPQPEAPETDEVPIPSPAGAAAPRVLRGHPGERHVAAPRPRPASARGLSRVAATAETPAAAPARPCCASSASAAPASTPSTAWSRPRSRASSSSPSTPTSSRCRARPPTSTCTSARASPAAWAPGPTPSSAGPSAMEEYDKIKSLLKGSDMVFITAGSGGGTGTGAAPDRRSHRARDRRADRRHRHQAVRLRGLAPARPRPTTASRRWPRRSTRSSSCPTTGC